MGKDEQKEDENTGNGYIKYSGIGFQMIAIIGAFTYAGYKIDESYQHTTKWVTAILSLTGVFISLYVIIRSVKS
ncbi:MAG: AtpZ/AtpI family protein [Sphingobacteriales bacterium]